MRKRKARATRPQSYAVGSPRPSTNDPGHEKKMSKADEIMTRYHNTLDALLAGNRPFPKTNG